MLSLFTRISNAFMKSPTSSAERISNLVRNVSTSCFTLCCSFVNGLDSSIGSNKCVYLPSSSSKSLTDSAIVPAGSSIGSFSSGCPGTGSAGCPTTGSAGCPTTGSAGCSASSGCLISAFFSASRSTFCSSGVNILPAYFRINSEYTSCSMLVNLSVLPMRSLLSILSNMLLRPPVASCASLSTIAKNSLGGVSFFAAFTLP